jgi:hypothetical protein
MVILAVAGSLRVVIIDGRTSAIAASSPAIMTTGTPK